MIAQLIKPIASLHGKLTRQYYVRTLANGRQVISRCPNRKGHVPTPAERANQQRFAEQYAKRTRDCKEI